jgi:hypothetical protein
VEDARTIPRNVPWGCIFTPTPVLGGKIACHAVIGERSYLVPTFHPTSNASVRYKAIMARLLAATDFK